MTMMMTVIIMIFTPIATIVVTNIDENVQFYTKIEALLCRLVGVKKRKRKGKMNKAAIINGAPLVPLY